MEAVVVHLVVVQGRPCVEVCAEAPSVEPKGPPCQCRRSSRDPQFPFGQDHLDSLPTEELSAVLVASRVCHCRLPKAETA